MHLLIRNTEPEDIPRLLELEQQYFSFPHVKEQFEREIHDPVYSLITACDKEYILGYAGLMHVEDEGYITNIVICKEYRRLGVANLLLAEFDRIAKQLELSFISLEVRASNYAAIQLYLKNGYIKNADLPKYYDKPKEDGIIMTKWYLKENKVENSGI